MILQNPENPNRRLYLPAIETVARSLDVQLSVPDVRNDLDIETAITEAGRGLNAGLIVLPGPFTGAHRGSIIALAARHRLPAVYPFRFFVANGGLIAYGLDSVDIIRRAASYVDRIFKGEKPGDLPVQQPTKFELVINLETAKALGLTVPLTLQVAADEVIE
jgi:putative ABC transport system substrate-binding protein